MNAQQTILDSVVAISTTGYPIPVSQSIVSMPKSADEFTLGEGLGLISGGFVPMNEMCERAGMSERQIFERTKAVFGYFNLPFDMKG